MITAPLNEVLTNMVGLRYSDYLTKVDGQVVRTDHVLTVTEVPTLIRVGPALFGLFIEEGEIKLLRLNTTIKPSRRQLRYICDIYGDA
jgi:hypothetical protein